MARATALQSLSLEINVRHWQFLLQQLLLRLNVTSSCLLYCTCYPHVVFRVARTHVMPCVPVRAEPHIHVADHFGHDTIASLSHVPTTCQPHARTVARHSAGVRGRRNVRIRIRDHGQRSDVKPTSSSPRGVLVHKRPRYCLSTRG